MSKISYYYSKFFKKYVRGKSIIGSDIDKSSSIASGSLVSGSKFGKYSYCGYDCTIINTEIGNYCSLADNVVIGSAQHPMDWVSTSPVFENTINSGPKKRFSQFPVSPTKRTIIGSDVWIGQSAIIKGGVTIGSGAVVGAGAVVTRDVPPYSIVGGCPAKIIRYRFDEGLRKGLVESEWWNLPDNIIQQLSEYITTPEIFLTEIQKIK